MRVAKEKLGILKLLFRAIKRDHPGLWELSAALRRQSLFHRVQARLFGLE
jgi:hypothetical protein